MDWLFERYGDVGVSKSVLDDAVDMATCQGHIEVARTLQARGDEIIGDALTEPLRPYRAVVPARAAMQFVRKAP